MSPAPAAPKIASTSAWHNDVAVRVAVGTTVERDHDAGEHERPAFDQAVEVVARADARADADLRVAPRPRSSGVVIFEIPFVTQHHRDRPSQPLDEHCLVSGRAGIPPAATASDSTGRANPCGV